MNYQTGIPIPQPATPAMRTMAQQGLGAPSPMSFGGSHNDVYAGLAKKNQMQFDRSAQEANAQSVDQARQIQMQMAMRGLEQLAQQRQNAADIATRRQRAMFDQTGGMLNGLLGGLFQ